MTEASLQPLIAIASPIIERDEGRISHFYLDGRRYVTIGVGHRVLRLADAMQLDLSPKPSIAQDFTAVWKAPSGYNAEWYAQFCQSRMSDAAITALKDRDITKFVTQLSARLPQVLRYPPKAQEAVVDMAYNLGVTGFLKYDRLIAALDRGDGESAAKECFRFGLGDSPGNPGERNKNTAELLRDAFQNC